MQLLDLCFGRSGDKGDAVNGGWMSDNPDFLWRPAGFADWSGTNARNPFVDPKLVKEIYMKSIGEDAPA